LLNPCLLNVAVCVAKSSCGCGTPGALGAAASMRPPRKGMEGPPLEMKVIIIVI
jgi:hypothetical protein